MSDSNESIATDDRTDGLNPRPRIAVGLYVLGFVSLALSIVALHDDQKAWVRDVAPGIWEWAVEGCVIGRSEAVESVPALLLVWVAVVACWLARRFIPYRTGWRIASSVIGWMSTIVGVLGTLLWVMAMFYGLPGGC